MWWPAARARDAPAAKVTSTCVGLRAAYPVTGKLHRSWLLKTVLTMQLQPMDAEQAGTQTQ